MNVLALDLSTHVGWAHGPPGGSIAFGTIHLKNDGDASRAFRSYSCWLRDFLDITGADLVAYEAPLNLGAMARSGASNAGTLALLNGLAALTEGIAGGCFGKRVRKVTPQQWRKAVLGNGRPDDAKLAGKLWARQLGWMVKTDHEADALGVHWWAAGQSKLL